MVFRSRFVFQIGACLMISNSSTTECPAMFSQSLTSPLAGRPGRSTIFTCLAIFHSDLAIFSACFLPGSSLSGRIITSRPCNDFENNSSHFSAPCAFVVDNSPRENSRSQSFSPSTMNTGSVERWMISGR